MKTLFEIQDYFSFIPSRQVLRRGNPNFKAKYSDKTKVMRIPIYLESEIKEFIANKENNQIQINEIIEIQENKPNFVTQLKDDDYEIAIVDPQSIQVDPRRFQFKQVHNSKTGSSGSLKSVKIWDPVFAGLLQVWRDPDNGLTYVVNGHNRLNLALSLGVKTIAIQYLNCFTAKEARVKGALHNMIDGKGSLLDCAKILKETNLTKQDLKKLGIATSDSFIDKSINLSNLETWLFEKTMLGELDEKQAVVIGSLDKPNQKTMYDMVKSYKGSLTDRALLEIKNQIELSNSNESQSLDLFGNQQEVVNLAIHRSKIINHIEQKLRRSAKIFGLVSNDKNHDLLDEVVDNIDCVASCLKKEQAQQILDIFLIEKNLSGVISDKINECVNKEINNENVHKVRDELLSWLILYIGSAHNFLNQLIG